MAFSGPTALVKIGGADPALYIYKSADAQATVQASGYFNSAGDFLMNGDVIIIVDTNVPDVDIVMVSSADKVGTSGPVTVAALNVV